MFLLVAFGFALACVEVVHAPHFFDQIQDDWGRAAPIWVWILQAWVRCGTAVIALLFVVQFAISFFPYKEATQSFLASKGWGTHFWWATVLVSFAFAAIALPIFVALILIATGTVGNALLFMKTDGSIDIR